MVYKTSGVCSGEIAVELDGSRIKNVQFKGGCNGNLQAVALLVEGMEAADAVMRLRGINCGGKGTSCADQLTYAIEMALKETA